MYMGFDQSDDYFVELVRDSEKRAKALLSYKKKRKLYFLCFVLMAVCALIDLFAAPEMMMLAIVLFANSFFFLAVHVQFENRVKLLLTIDEQEKMAAEGKAV
ncbi:MAG: hypothetical protein COA78_21440 [Blastopirellula sp.]|nr:MAG: hypothetical protein COA78_21440 [Blastopirellula sp.]